MNKPLLWKLCYTIAAGAVLLFWAIGVLSERTEQQMSFIDAEHQAELLAMGRAAEQIYTQQGEVALQSWLEALQAREQTWAAVVRSQLTPLANGVLSEQFIEGFRLGRSVSWKIHLYFPDNPIMDVTFRDGRTHFLIRLPQRMRPGTYLQPMQTFLQFVLPLLVLILLSVVLYRHVMLPLRQLEQATRQFSEGHYEVRVKACLGNRNDELAALAETFDRMAERTGRLIVTQRQLIADLSHELRTPLARMDMALDCLAQNIKPEASVQRIKYETGRMRSLVDDTLTLAWLENEQPSLCTEPVDLLELLDIIIADARFEFPAQTIITRFPESAVLARSSHRALGQALENIIRNALRYTPEGGTVTIGVLQLELALEVKIMDEGPGVPVHYLSDIFRPFFRLESLVTEAAKQQLDAASELSYIDAALTRVSLTPEHDAQERVPASLPAESWSSGCGLGLALARRQIEAVGGTLRALNRARIGLEMRVTLPV